MEWFEFDLNGLNKMININNSDKQVSALEDYSLISVEGISKKTEDSITRFDRKKENKCNIKITLGFFIFILFV